MPRTANQGVPHPGIETQRRDMERGARSTQHPDLEVSSDGRKSTQRDVPPTPRVRTPDAPLRPGGFVRGGGRR